MGVDGASAGRVEQWDGCVSVVFLVAVDGIVDATDGIVAVVFNDRLDVGGDIDGVWTTPL